MVTLLYDCYKMCLKGSRLNKSRSPALWWNSKCTKIINSRNVFYRIYRASPTLDNLIALKWEIDVERSCKKKRGLASAVSVQALRRRPPLLQHRNLYIPI